MSQLRNIKNQIAAILIGNDVRTEDVPAITQQIAQAVELWRFGRNNLEEDSMETASEVNTIGPSPARRAAEKIHIYQGYKYYTESWVVDLTRIIEGEFSDKPAIVSAGEVKEQ